MRWNECLQLWLVFTLLLSVVVSSTSNRQGRRLRTEEEENWYEQYCSDEKRTNGFQSKWEEMRAMCLCGHLNDVIQPQTQLESIRTQPSGEAALALQASKSSAKSSPSLLVTEGPVTCIDGKAEITGGGNHPLYPCSNVDLLSFVSLSELNAVYGRIEDEIHDVWGWTDGVNEIAIVGGRSGTSFVDVTIPTNPKILGKLPGIRRTWAHDIKTYQNYVFIVSEGGNLEMLDINYLIEQKDSIPEGGIVIASNNSTFGNWNSAHNLHINEETGYAYVVGSNLCQGGLYIVDIGNPSKPNFLGCYSDDGYTHDVQCVIYHGDDIRYKGREICFACNEDTVTIVDVTDKISPSLVSKTSYEEKKYTHQGWLTEDHNYLMFGDEYDEVRAKFTARTRSFVLQVSDLQNPSMTGVFLSKSTAIDHNQYVVGNFVFQANYQAGLRILQVDDPTTAKFTEVGYFDIYPDGDFPAFNGAWGVYPFFPSGIIVVSGIEQGLFVLERSTGGDQEISMCDYDQLCNERVSMFQAAFSRFRQLFFPEESRSTQNRYVMHRTQRTGRFLGLRSNCKIRCFSETEVLQMKDQGWECGTCDA